MRPTRLMSLVLLWLLTSAACTYAQHPRRARPPAPNEVVASFEVTAYGETYNDAYESAIKDAQSKLASWVAAEDPSLHWKPSVLFVQRLIKKAPRVDSRVKLEKVGLVTPVCLQLEVTQNDVQFILKETRELRSAERMLFLGKVLAGLVAFCLAISGYFRLEEATKGYYTNWLRLGALGFVTAIGVTLLLIS
jgi:hypothetical protein